ncbi:phosphopentomutase [Sulfobacillus thermosulfidooxidans]|uniref:phosphopentomutase n=1 Tax=Sulfobacillus thermosulfidooxidans TaxID=28034 RepID=UPI0006B657DB|nr:phosphopentomutase [Sulfobacillus thermosulfidooxidans]
MRITLIIIDSGGIGAAPDAARFGDEGANTIGHVARYTPNFSVPHLAAMGLHRLVPLPNDQAVPLQGISFPVIPLANGKDTLAGHWEMMGIRIQEPFQTFPQGFPEPILTLLKQVIKRPILGNEVASGTEIIDRLGRTHLQTGYPIVYTSADSVLQIAAHEEIIAPELLYQWCKTLRDVLDEKQYRIGRIIARPFTGKPGQFARTPRRHDFAVKPPGPTVIDHLAAHGIQTTAIGKIGDIFSGQGFSRHLVTRSNYDGLEKTLAALDKNIDANEFIFTNLVEFDSHFGHRRDVLGYAQALQELDAFLPELWKRLGPDDQLWISADHGCDPTFTGTDHTREMVPWLVYGPRLRPAVGSSRSGLGDIGATLMALWQIPPAFPGNVAKPLLQR